MLHKAEWMGRPMKLELTRVGLLVKLANHYTTRGAQGVVLDDLLWVVFIFIWSGLYLFE